jgi:hypothetical protein
MSWLDSGLPIRWALAGFAAKARPVAPVLPNDADANAIRRRIEFDREFSR